MISQLEEVTPILVGNKLHSVNDATGGNTQESPMGDSWVIPRKVDKMVWVSAQFSFEENDGYFLQQHSGKRKWWVIPTTRQGRITINQ